MLLLMGFLYLQQAGAALRCSAGLLTAVVSLAVGHRLQAHGLQ